MEALTLEQKIRRALQSLNLEKPDIEVHGIAPSVIATVVTGSFSDMDEAERQRLVWKALRDSLDEDERAGVEFVFTIAPDDPFEATSDESASG